MEFAIDERVWAIVVIPGEMFFDESVGVVSVMLKILVIVVALLAGVVANPE